MNQVRDEGNRGRVTERGEEARECVRKCRPEIASGAGLRNAWLAEQGLLSMKTLWAELAHVR